MESNLWKIKKKSMKMKEKIIISKEYMENAMWKKKEEKSNIMSKTVEQRRGENI